MDTPVNTPSPIQKANSLCIPDAIPAWKVHLMGRFQCDRSSMMARMVLDGVTDGEGAAVLDPYGDLVARLVRLIPREHAGRVIYAAPGDPKHILLWNPLKAPAPDTIPGLSPGRIADEIVNVLKGSGDDCGARSERLLHNSITAVMRLANGTLRDVADLLRRRSAAGKRLQRAILERLDDVSERHFWIEDFQGYTCHELHQSLHKLSMLLACGPVRRMLSNGGSSFDLRDVMDNGKILLMNLSSIGSQTRQILGCLLLSLLRLATLSRSNVVGCRRQFHICCDGADHFVTDAMENLIAESHRLGVRLTLADQHLGLFGQRKIGTFSTVCTTVLRNTDGRDGPYLETYMLEGLTPPSR